MMYPPASILITLLPHSVWLHGFEYLGKKSCSTSTSPSSSSSTVRGESQPNLMAVPLNFHLILRPSFACSGRQVNKSAACFACDVMLLLEEERSRGLSRMQDATFEFSQCRLLLIFSSLPLSRIW